MDYIHPLKDAGQIEGGYKAIIRNLENDFLRKNQMNGTFETDMANTDVFTFNEQVHALYAQYSGWSGEKQSPKWKYTIGLRAEQIWNNGKAQNADLKFDKDYFNLFPSASLIYYTPKQDMVKASYGKRINRPSFGQLMPFTDITDALNQRSGNPNLKPELSHSFELSYGQNRKSMNYILTAFYRYQQNIILPFTVLDDNGVAFTQPQNFNDAFSYGLEGIVTFSPFKFWGFNLNVSGYSSQVKNDDTPLNSRFVYFAKIINNFTPWTNGRIQIIANYASPTVIPQGQNAEVYFVDVGIQQRMMKGQGRLGLTVTDIFNTQHYGTRTSDDNFNFSRIFKLDTRAVMFVFGYTFKSAFKEKLMDNKFTN